MAGVRKANHWSHISIWDLRRSNRRLSCPRPVALHGRVDQALSSRFRLVTALDDHHRPGNSAGGFPQPKVDFITRWGFELVIISIYTVGAVSMLIYGIRKKHRSFLLFPGVLVAAAGLVFHNKGLTGSYILLVIGMMILAVGIFYFIQRPSPKPQNLT